MEIKLQESQDRSFQVKPVVLVSWLEEDMLKKKV